MSVQFFPDKKAFSAAKEAKDPLLVLISFDGKRLLVAPADESMEHVLLLKQLGYSERDLDQYFRVVLNTNGADWTFVCPMDYKKIPQREMRIKQFYKDGFSIIPRALSQLGYAVPLEIPKRFQRHIHSLGNGTEPPPG